MGPGRANQSGSSAPCLSPVGPGLLVVGPGRQLGGAGSWGPEVAVRYGDPRRGEGGSRQGPHACLTTIAEPQLSLPQLPLPSASPVLPPPTASFPHFAFGPSHFKPSAPHLMASLLSLSPDGAIRSHLCPQNSPPSCPLFSLHMYPARDSVIQCSLLPPPALQGPGFTSFK